MAFMTNDPKKARLVALKHKQFVDKLNDKRASAKKRVAHVRKVNQGPRTVLNTIKEVRYEGRVNSYEKKAIEKSIRRKMEPKIDRNRGN